MIDEINRLGHRLRSMIGRGRLTLVDDTGPAQTAQIDLGPIGPDGKSMSIRDNTFRLAEYGFSSHPPAGADAMVLHLGGDRSNSIIVSTGHQQYRLRNLGAGEVALYDQWGNTVRLGEAGMTLTHTAKITLAAPTVDVAGALTVGGVAVTVP